MSQKLDQAWAVVRLETKRNFFSRRSLWIYLVALAPVLIFTLHAVAMHYRGRACNLQNDVRTFATVFQTLILRGTIFFGCLGLFMNLFRRDVMEKSLHYYFLAPLRREYVLGAKYVSGMIMGMAVFGASVLLCFAALLAHVPAQQASEFLWQQGGAAQIAAYTGVTALAIMGYGAVFLMFGLLFQSPMVPSVLLLLWESLNVFLPEALKQISVIFYLRSLCPVAVAVDRPSGMLALLVINANPSPVWVAIPGLLMLTAVLLSLACLRVRRYEIRYGTE